jgi:hypothetical protein
VGIEVMRFAELNETFQQIALAVDITYRAMGVQLGFAHFNGKARRSASSASSFSSSALIFTRRSSNGFSGVIVLPVSFYRYQ